MSIVQRYIWLGILYTLSLSALFLFIFLFAFPVSTFQLLWEKEIMEIPFIMFFPAVSLFIGAVVGGSIGYYWQKQLDSITADLIQLEHGKPIKKSPQD